MTVLVIVFLFLISLYCGCIEETPKKKISNIIYVDNNGNGDFKSIQDAINASINGNSIIVRPGTYNENLNINKSIKLIGDDKNTTIIIRQDTGGIADLITVEANNASIENFTFKNE